MPLVHFLNLIYKNTFYYEAYGFQLMKILMSKILIHLFRVNVF